jgi:hypothetical protein
MGCPYRRSSGNELPADLLADGVFLIVESAPFLPGGVGAVLARNEALFRADLPVVAMQRPRPLQREFALVDFLMNTDVLIGEAVIHFGPARMVLLPWRLGDRAAGNAGAE